MQITPDEKVLLNEIISRRKPELLHLVQNLGMHKLTDEDRLLIQSTLSDEIVERGLNPDDEPNKLGSDIDAIIGKLQFY